MKRLGRLGRAEATALLRAAIRFWERREEPTAKSLRDLGLIRDRRRGVSRGTKRFYEAAVGGSAAERVAYGVEYVEEVAR